MIKIGDRIFAPEEVSAELLKAMKKYAEAHFGGKEVKKAVITIPAYFDQRQRAATERAARMAGLEVVRLLTEPTAAAIAFGIKNRNSKRTIMVYDLGGGTFDVTIGRIVEDKGKDPVLKTLGVAGHSHLGGEDFDEIIVKDYIENFEDKHQTQFPDDKNIRRKLLNQCREAKENMTGTKADQFIDNVHPDEVVAIGAAILAAQLTDPSCENRESGPQRTVPSNQAGQSNQYSQSNQPSRSNQSGQTNNQNDISIDCEDLNWDQERPFMRLDIRETVPLSIGMELRGKAIKVAIERGTIYPYEVKIQTFTVINNQPSFEADIYEGERARTDAEGMTKIGTIVMGDLEKKPRGNPHTADISRFVEEAKAHKEEDEKFRNASRARRSFEHYLYDKIAEFERNTRIPQSKFNSATNLVDRYLAYCGDFPNNAAEIEREKNNFNRELSELFKDLGISISNFLP
ncbi:hypothetical protein WR25_27232 [Diploscapter pachys]|uniref:Uncharacterized protein n=1 Tax=Diploscapter pachys TaxID=2018661 RepID=A0A2A2JRZ5_9BILA|nr:hypothetical protein WR25_27232 [Diploscapter pachys]